MGSANAGAFLSLIIRPSLIPNTIRAWHRCYYPLLSVAGAIWSQPFSPYPKNTCIKIFRLKNIAIFVARNKPIR